MISYGADFNGLAMVSAFRSPLALLALAAPLLLAWGLYGLRGAAPRPGEATALLAVESLWHDRNLRFEPQDLRRIDPVWNRGAAGLALLSADRGTTLRYAIPCAYPVAAVPFYALFGPAGLPILNTALLLSVLIGAWAWARRRTEGWPGWWAGGFFLASAALPWALGMQTAMLPLACSFFALWLVFDDSAEWKLALAAALLATATIECWPAVWLALPLAVQLVLRRRWRSLATVGLVFFLSLGALAALQWKLTRSGDPLGDPRRRTFAADFPLEKAGALWALEPMSLTTAEPVGAAPLRPSILGRNLLYLVAGRHTGLLVWFPFAFLGIALFFAGWRDRLRLALALALAAACLSLLLSRSFGPAAFAALYPACFFLPRRNPGWKSLLPAWLAVGLWTAPSLLAALAPGPVAPAAFRAAALQALPLEVTRLRDLPGYALRSWGEALWIVPVDNFSVEEEHPNGVWVRGASRSEVVVVSDQPVDRLRFQVAALSAESELVLDSGVQQVKVRFDTEGKRAGTPVALAVRPSLRDPGYLPGAGGETLYRFTLTTRGGLVPARQIPGSVDPRYLGVFLDFTGGGF